MACKKNEVGQERENNRAREQQQENGSKVDSGKGRRAVSSEMKEGGRLDSRDDKVMQDMVRI